MPPQALITRPRDDAQGIAQALEERAFTVLIEPLLDIVIRHGISLPRDGVQGFLATSANGVRALAANLDDRALPLWAVGDATARQARAMGFARVESAGGDVEALAALVAARLDPGHGALLHAAGSKLAGDLAGRLGRSGFEVRRAVLYEARTATVFSSRLIAALDAQSLDLALFFSPRTAATFVTLAEAAGRGEACRTIVAYALSPAVEAQLARLAWRHLRVATRPDQEALLAAIDQDRNE